MNITPELWRTVEPLLGTAIEMDAATRTTWLLDIDRAQPEVAPLLRKLLVAHERAERSGELDTVPPLLPRAGSSSAYSEAQRIGPFALLRALGHGGMGEVWLARQADGRVERNVALKLPAIHLQGETWRERFRRERDILARLEHPHIARLYDAGVTDAGQPWLAMEFVEGLSLTDHVRARALSMLQCLGLFRQVLAAVAHAHRHLVVHRDLKPANILIDAAGQVKLLDFGIAKLVDEGQSGTAAQDLTRVGGRMMTLRYAAPEQVAAGAITTATDVYALGVILHEMMTGLSPYRAVREGKALTDVMLLQEEVAVPSGLAIPKPLARSLSGDLDAIVLKALRRDPVERYASVERFDEDIRAYLEKRPVKARAGTWRYLAGRFVVRHKLPLAMATAVLATLAAGLVMVDQQRRVAVAERARAEKHFASVRKLANTFIVDVHAEIENLAGSLKAREMLIGTSLEYLNALAGEAGSDPALQHELAVAYMNVANIQGQPTNANRGNFVAATGNYEKARDLLVAADAARPGQATLLRDLARLRYSLARSYFTVSDPRWQPELVATIELAGRVAALPAATRSDRAFVALALSEKAHMTSLMSGLTPEVEAALKQAVAIQEALVREAPGEFTLRETLVRLYMRAASGLAHTGHSERSLRESTGYAITARDLARALSAERPSDSTLQARVYVATLDLAMVYSLAGRHREADANIEEAIAFTTRLSAGDPENITRVHDRVYSLSQGALIAYRLGDGASAVARGREAVAIVATWSTEALMSRDVQARVAEANMYLGLALLVASDSAPRARRAALLREARPLIAGGVAFIADFRARKIGSVPEEHFQEMSQALARCDEAIARLG